MKRFQVGDRVRWNSEAGRVSGVVTRVHVRDFDWHGYIRHCSDEAPQYETRSDGSDHVAVHEGGALRRA